MYTVVNYIPRKWDIEGRGIPVAVLEDECGGQSVIGIDDHCYVLYNGSADGEFRKAYHWYKEAALALRDFLNENLDFRA